MSSINLVTGGAGFVGLHLVNALLARGEKVRVLDVVTDGLAELDVEVVQGSITDPAVAAIACADIDYVFHLAGNAQLWTQNPDVFEDVNHQGSIVMAQAAGQAGVKRFIHCSSLTTLVGVQTPIGKSDANEETRLDPAEMLGDYPASKLKAEMAVMRIAKDMSMDAIIAIPTEPLGAGDESLTPPTQMILDFVNGKTPAFIDCILNFVPVEALAQGFIAARDKGVDGERYLLAGENVPMHILLEKLESATGQKMPKVKMPYQVALLAGFVDTKLVSAITRKPPKAPLTGVRLAGRQVRFSSDKALLDLNWQASDWEAALNDMLAWAKARTYI